MISLEELTIDQVHYAYKNGELTSRQLVEAFLTRIEALDGKGPKLNAILALSSSALSEADALDAHLKSTSQLIGPLHGIPVIVKDQAETKDIVTTYGSIVAKDNVPSEDATLVKKLKRAGAVVLAKSTMPDWAASWFSTSSLSGVTRNPYSLDRDPGGSSSGTGAAIAANFAILGLGEDTGGSIRLPSSFCSLVGLRCTPGLVSRKGLSPLIVPQDTPGPMTRTVRDAALMLDAIAGFDIEDPYTATAAIAGSPSGGSYAANLNLETISKSRIGVLRSGFGDDADSDCHAVNAIINHALKSLQRAGTTLVDVQIPNLAHYLTFTSTYFSRSRCDIDRFLATKPPHLATTCAQIHASKRYHPALDLFEGIATGPATPTDDPEYFQRLEARDDFQRLVIGIMAQHQVSALAFPDVQVPAPTHTDILNGRWTCLQFPTNTIIASQLWMPAISVPAGFTDAGLPVGLELMGLPFQEQKLLELAFGVEQLTLARRPPSL